MLTIILAVLCVLQFMFITALLVGRFLSRISGNYTMLITTFETKPHQIETIKRVLQNGKAVESESHE